jgi:hypothetical protein
MEFSVSLGSRFEILATCLTDSLQNHCGEFLECSMLRAASVIERGYLFGTLFLDRVFETLISSLTFLLDPEF